MTLSKQTVKFILTFLLTSYASVAFSQQYDEGTPGLTVLVESLGSKTTAELNLSKKLFVPPYGVDLVTRPAPALASFSKSLSRSSSYKENQIGLNFTAATVSNVPNPNVIPPNLNGWVGENQYILMSYGVIRSFDKLTGLPDGVLLSDAASFFNFQANDVRIDYDRFAKRLYFSAEKTSSSQGPKDLFLAVSSDSVITDSTKWFFYHFPASLLIPQNSPPGSGSLDYSQLAVDRNAVYISVGTFDINDGFQGTSTLVISKKSLLKDNFLVTVFPGILGPNAVSSVFESEFTPPADNFDLESKFGYLINAMFSFPFPEYNIGNELFFFRIANPGSPAPTLSKPISLKVPEYAIPANAPHLDNLYGGSGLLQNGIFGGIEAPHVRGKQLYACHAIQVNRNGKADPNGDRIGIRWYQFDLTGDPKGKGSHEETLTTVPVLVQSGTLFDSDQSTSTPLSYYTPSIMTNKKKDLFITATVSGANQYTNVIFAGRSKKDHAGLLRTPVYVTQNFTNPYNFGPLVDPSNGNIGQRWGDESSLSPDPSNDLDIWLTGEWAAITNGWGIQVTQIKPL